MLRLSTSPLQAMPPLQCHSLANHVTIALLNVRSIPDIAEDSSLKCASILFL